ncbi:hypothetical protein GCM10011494_13600 [Novosphingobium endophyticum]|uniref:DUF389 domain-containing protein n=1 Tax=Novosphingobium endophyticum TaxID=1955250 RepID=A0A916X409_9SPHN|nr:DUF389 domain-containing protein [Novosphingobium endophyticum]GGB96397.1 hypothetical protein GCM10011494_13600 [Novosphingobium endophyticum]
MDDDSTAAPEVTLPGQGTPRGARPAPGANAQREPNAAFARKIAAAWKKRPRWVRRIAAFIHLIRIRIAKAVLLPQLTPDLAYDLRQTVRREGQLTNGYILMSALAAGIATLGLLQSSTAVVIGAMLVSPLMSPIAALGFGFASLDGHRIRDAARVVAIGAAVGIITGLLLTWLSPIRNATPEILARTEPNLLDLAIALFSGIAGGYATVIGKGGTAIGVAIATALMPPLTVIGYGIGVLQPMFTLGALLLFLTNLAAITFAFAVIARLSGAARPFGKVEWTPRYVAILVTAFLALGTPLSMTLMKLSEEAQIRSAARSAILEACGEEGVTIAQLDVNSSVFGEPSVNALVIARNYTANAEASAEELLHEKLGEVVQINLQQVLAADVQAQTRAMVDAAMERTAAGIAADVPPFNAIRQSVGLPTRAVWSDRAQRTVYIEPIPAPEWTLADYRATEQRAGKAVQGWTVRVVPPARSSLTVLLAPTDAANAPTGAIGADLALWALQRWGMGKVTVSGTAEQKLPALVKLLIDAGIEAEVRPSAPATGAADETAGTEAPPPTATIRVYALSPSQQAAEAARIAAEKAAAEKTAEKTAAE